MSAAVPLAPLLSAPLALRLEPFRRWQALGSVDVHVVDHLGALVGATEPDVLLALALAVRAPRHGHVCVDIRRLDVASLLPEVEQGREPEVDRPVLPADREAWVQRVAASPLVRSPAQVAQVAPFLLDGATLYTERYFAYQTRLAADLAQRFEALLPPRDPGLLQRGLRELFRPQGAPASGNPPPSRQQLAAAMAMLRGFTVVSGGPGAGKTYTVRNVLTLAWAQWATEHDPTGDVVGPRVALAAPTGKAAARMKESVEARLGEYVASAAGALPEGRTSAQLQAFLSSLRPVTLHRLLRFDPRRPTRFRHDAASPVPFDVVVVDEASMVDLALMAKLVDAVAPSAQLVLLGDKNQLASVEAGTVLADLCGPVGVERLELSRSFCGELAEHAGLRLGEEVFVVADPGPQDAILQLDGSHRFAADSGVGAFARACLARPFRARAALEILTHPQRYADMALMAHGRDGTLTRAVERVVVRGFRPYLERLLAGPRGGETFEDLHRDALRLFDGFRLLCAHRRGRLGVQGMNRAVVELLDEERLRLAKEMGAVSPLAGLRPYGDLWCGRPVLVLRNDYVVGRFNGDIGLMVEAEGGGLTVAFPEEGGVRYVAPARLPEHQTVFAMTIHKSQGSEFRHVMIVLPQRESPILTRELVYTGVTRAREKMTLLGDPDLLESALERTVRRASGLQAALWGSDTSTGSCS